VAVGHVLAFQGGTMSIEQIQATRLSLHALIDAVPGALYAKDREGRILFGNAGFGHAVGWPSGGFLGKDDLELIADKDLARAVMDNDQRIMGGRVRCQVEEKLRTADGTASYWLSTKAPLTDEDGKVVGLVGVSVDITERKRLEEQENLRAQEVEHRNKNLLSVVQSVVHLTRAPTVEAFRQTVTGRLEALGRVESVLMRESLKPVSLRTLLLEELAAYNINTSDRVRLEGPPIYVRAEAGQPLAMAFHELATNAAKYGAFAEASGTLDVAWELQRSGTRLEIEWRENRRSPVESPVRQGFGTKLIRTLVERQLRGTVSFVWGPAGLRCTIVIPMQTAAPN
jgi:PAS domain S-box-containing protein